MKWKQAFTLNILLTYKNILMCLHNLPDYIFIFYFLICIYWLSGKLKKIFIHFKI